MANLGDMVISIVGDTTGLNKSLTDSQKKMAAFGVNVAAVTAAIIQMGKRLADATKEYADYGSLIDDASKRTGLSTDAIQEWKYIAEQAGTTLEAVTGSVGMMTRGLETNRAEFERLGIETKNIDGSFRSTTDIFNDTVLTLSAMKDETARDQAAFKLLGRSAQSLIPILKDGEAGINAMKEEARGLGIIIDKETITKADALGDAMLALNTSMKAAKLVIINDFAPALLEIALQFKDVIDKTISYRKELDAYKSAMQGTKLTQSQLTDAIRGTMTETKNLESAIANLEPGYESQRAELEKQLAASKALEQSLRAQAKALASAAESNRLGTEASRKKAEADAAQAEQAATAARLAQEQVEKQKELIVIQEQVATDRANQYGDWIARHAEVMDAVDQQSEQQHQAEMERIEKEKQARIDSLTYAYSQITAIVDQAFDNEIANIENSEKSEEEKAKLIAQVRRKQAVWDKTQAIVDIAINTATAVTKALPNLFLAGLIGALGVAQAAFVAAQPIPPLPLAEGGIVMPTEGGTLAQIAEAGQPEAVIPLDKLGSIGGDIHLVVQMDSKPFLDKIFPATRDRTILISAGAVV